MKLKMSYTIKKVLLLAVLFGIYELLNRMNIAYLQSVLHDTKFLVVLLAMVSVISFKWKYYDRAANRTLVLDANVKDTIVKDLDYIRKSNLHDEGITKTVESYLQLINMNEITFREIKNIRKYIHKHDSDKR